MKLFNGKQQQANIINDRFPSNKSIFGDLCANIYPNPVTFSGRREKGQQHQMVHLSICEIFFFSVSCGCDDGDDELA